MTCEETHARNKEKTAVREALLLERAGNKLAEAAKLLDELNMPFVFGVQLLNDEETPDCAVFVSDDFDDKAGAYLEVAQEILKSRCGCELVSVARRVLRSAMIARIMEND